MQRTTDHWCPTSTDTSTTQPQISGTLQKCGVETLWVPEDQEVCCVIVSTTYYGEPAPTRSQKYGCLSKTITICDITIWMGGISWGPTQQVKNYGQLMATEKGRISFVQLRAPNMLASPKWSDINIHIWTTVNGFSRLYLYVHVHVYACMHECTLYMYITKAVIKLKESGGDMGVEREWKWCKYSPHA